MKYESFFERYKWPSGSLKRNITETGLRFFNNRAGNRKFYFSGGNIEKLRSRHATTIAEIITIIISDKKTKLPIGRYNISISTIMCFGVDTTYKYTIYKNKTKKILDYKRYDPNWSEVEDFFFYEETLLAEARKKAASKIVTVEEELKQTVEKAQTDAEAKIAEAKKAAQQLIDDAKLDWESRKAIFDKYDYDSVNEALRAKQFTDSELSDEDILSINISEGGYFTKPKQVLDSVKSKIFLQKFSHPILKHMKG